MAEHEDGEKKFCLNISFFFKRKCHNLFWCPSKFPAQKIPVIEVCKGFTAIAVNWFPFSYPS